MIESMDILTDRPENSKDNSIKLSQTDRRAAKISFIRTYYSLSKTDFAKRTVFSEVHLRRIEKGDAALSSNVLGNICRAFGIDERYFDDDIVPSDLEKYVYQAERETDGLTEAERLRELRVENNLTQKELGDRAGCSRTVIADAERGQRELSEENAEKIADALEVGIEYLADGVKTRKRYPVNKMMISWLWGHEETRREIWLEMKRDGC